MAQGASPSWENRAENGNTPLHMACRNGHVAATRLLVELPGVGQALLAHRNWVRRLSLAARRDP